MEQTATSLVAERLATYTSTADRVRYGVVSYADSMDCVGVLGKKVNVVQEVFGMSTSRDHLADALDILSHPDRQDMSCVTASTRSRSTSFLESYLSRFPTYPSSPLTGLRIGLPVQTHLPSPNLQLPTALLEHLQSLGATLHPVSVPSIRMALPAYYVLASAEASSNLARFGGGWFGSPSERETDRDGESGEERRRRVRTEGFGREVKKRMLAGTYALSAEYVLALPSGRCMLTSQSEFNNMYLKALHLRRLLRHELSSIFRIPHPRTASPKTPEEGVDVLLHPTAIRTAPELGKASEEGESEYLQDVLTVPASLAGLPAMSIPAGRGEDGWPVGVSLVGQWGTERLLFWTGRGVETWQTAS